jgi:hypothetical protein
MAEQRHPRHFVNNFRTFDAPLSVKFRLVVKNHAIKIRKASGCCGNYGEPGC